jgi:hypothetical protein
LWVACVSYAERTLRNEGIAVVETQAQFDAWMNKQPSFYDAVVKGNSEKISLLSLLKAKEKREEIKGHHELSNFEK